MAVIRDLISYRLHTVANLLSRGAELRYRREFGVSLWEWRTIALLGAVTGALSLNHLAHAAGIHARRRLVQRAPDSRDARGVQLTLSKSGRRLYDGLIRAATERDQAFNGCLTAKERQVLETVLTKLAGRAREFIQREKR